MAGLASTEPLTPGGRGECTLDKGKRKGTVASVKTCVSHDVLPRVAHAVPPTASILLLSQMRIALFVVLLAVPLITVYNCFRGVALVVPPTAIILKVLQVVFLPLSVLDVVPRSLAGVVYLMMAFSVADINNVYNCFRGVALVEPPTVIILQVFRVVFLTFPFLVPVPGCYTGVVSLFMALMVVYIGSVYNCFWGGALDGPPTAIILMIFRVVLKILSVVLSFTLAGAYRFSRSPLRAP